MVVYIKNEISNPTANNFDPIGPDVLFSVQQRSFLYPGMYLDDRK